MKEVHVKIRNSQLLLTVLFSFVLLSLNAQKLNDTVKLKGVEIISVLPVAYMHSISSNAINQSPLADIGSLLRTLPSVSGIRKGGSGIDPVLRGLRFSQLNVLLNEGIKIEGGCPNRMDPVLSHIEIEDVESIEIFYVPNTFRYGPALGGIIQVNTAKPEQYQKFEMHTKAFAGFNSNPLGHREYLRVFGGNKWISLIASGGYKTYRNYFDGNGNEVNSSFTKYFYSADLSFFPFEGHEIHFAYKGSHARDVLFPALPMDESTDNTGIISFDYQIKTKLTHLKTFSTKIYRSTVEHIMDNSRRPQYSSVVPPYTGLMQAVADVDAVNQGMRLLLGYGLKNTELLSGVDWENINKDGEREAVMIMDMDSFTTVSKKRSNLWYKSKINNVGLFTDITHLLSKDLKITGSFRLDLNMATSADTLTINKDGVDYFNKNNVFQLNYSLVAGVYKALSGKMSLLLNLGRTMRSADMTERYIKFLSVGYDNFDYLGNPQLKPEINNQFQIKYSYLNVAGELEISPYFSFIQDYITGVKLPPSVAMPKTMGAMGVKQFQNASFAIITGGDLSFKTVEFLKGHLTFNISLSYTYDLLSSTQKYIVQNGQITGEETINYDAIPEIPPFEVYAGLNTMFFNKSLFWDVNGRYAASQLHVSEGMNEPTTPGFFIFNTSVRYAGSKYYSISAGVNNLFNTYYYEHLNRRIIGSTQKLSEPGRNFYIQAIINL